MASGDASPFPIKNQAFRVTFPILDADGDLVTGAAGLDSEVSKDAGTFADVTAEATEIATSSGVYYLDLTATEMNADTVAVIVKTSTAGAKTTTLVLYPVTLGDAMLGINVVQWLGTAAATPTVAGVPEVDLTHLGGVAQSATDLKDFADAGYDPGTNKVQGVVLVDTTTTNTDMVSEPLSAAAVNAEVVDVLKTDTITLPGQAAPPLTPTFEEALSWLYKVFRNRKTQTSTQWSLMADDETTVHAKATVSDDGTTAIKQEVVTGP